MSNFRPPATPVFESGRLERVSSSSKQPSYGIQRSYSTQSNSSNMSTMSTHRVVKEETDSKTGTKVQLVRSIPEEHESTQEIVDKLFQRYTYNYGGVRANQEDLDNFNKAFPNHGKKIIDTYEGSNIISDSNQALVGEEYYAKQIEDIKRKNKTSFLTKWDHLLYAGDETYKPSIATPLPQLDFSRATPTQSRTYSISQLPTASRQEKKTEKKYREQK